MEKSKIQAQIVRSNFSTMRYLSLVALIFSIFFLITDFSGVWYDQYMSFYRTMDFVFTGITIFGVSIIWFIKIKRLFVQKIFSTITPYLVLLWAAVITGVDFQMFGLSTFIIMMLLCAFFIYMNPVTSATYFLSSGMVLLATIYFSTGINENFIPLLFLMLSVVLFAVLMSARNYKRKINDLKNRDEIIEINKQLQNSNAYLESEVEKRTREIKIALERANESDRLKSAFLNNISHEIRTPLNSIAGFSKLMTKPDLSLDKLKKYSKQIGLGTEKLIEIISDLIEISQIQSKQLILKKSTFDFAQLAYHIIGEHKLQAGNREVSFIVNPELENIEYFVSSDRTKIHKILKHLIDNAVKFTQEGQIVLDFDLMPDNIEFTLTDTGIGIAKDMQQKIFEPFRQIEIGLSRNYGGNGLGLAIVKAFVEFLGGSLKLESEPNIGTSIFVCIPVVRVSNHSEKETIAPETKILKQTILIVEDEHSNYEYLAELLAKTTTTILHAANGQQAIDICRNEKKVDFVLMDLKMPIMDGYTAAKLIKAFRPDLPIIAQTAYAIENDREILLESGFDGHLSKPIEEDLLLETIGKFI